jgi:hypothetical protein
MLTFHQPKENTVGHIALTLYVAGPMRGYRRFNFDAFEEASTRLRSHGYTIVSPAEMDLALGFDPDGSLEEQGFDVHEALTRDFDAIAKADGIALLPGWEESDGAMAERFVAEKLGKRVYFYRGANSGAYPLVHATDEPLVLLREEPTPRQEAMLRHPSSQSGPPIPFDDRYEATILGYTNITPEGIARTGSHADQHDRFMARYHEELRKEAEKLVLDDPPRVTTPEPAAAEADTTNPKDLLGVKKPQLWLVPRSFIIRTAQAMADGARKYGPYNWREKAVRATVYQSAADRHLSAWLDGEDHATDSGYHHLAHAGACIAILIDAIETGNLVDDRPTPGAAGRLIAELTEQ